MKIKLSLRLGQGKGIVAIDYGPFVLRCFVMKHIAGPFLLAAVLSGCALVQSKPEDAAIAAPPADAVRPQSRPEGGVKRPPQSARTVEQFDTTTNAERTAAVQAAAAAPVSASLGRTVASLGDPSKPGIWLETPLVDAPSKGTVTYNGKSVQVDLLPIDGPKTAGSRLSLAAMRLLNAPLTGLPEVDVSLI